ncbi:CHAT domain-containing protein [Myxococcaceae bacterium GXIMD 01537]
MNTLCQKLHQYFDGELASAEEENFRHHLARCEDCANQLHELMQLELLGQKALDVPVPLADARPRLPRIPPRVMWNVGAVAALAASVLVLLTLSLRSTPPSEGWVDGASTRSLEARLTWPGADRYRPYVPNRGTGGPEAPLSLRELAGMEDRGELLGISAAYMLRGDAKQAAAFLSRAPASLDRDCDRAVVALEAKNYEEALSLLDGVLRVKSDHAQALWNRGLVLREMGLTAMAADAFDAVAKLGEPGWSEEARERARTLRQESHEHHRSWKDAQGGMRALISTPGAPLPLVEAGQHAGMARSIFYDVLYSAPSRERALALMPLAQELDRAYGGAVLSDAVGRVAERDFRRRAPLAQGYAQVVLRSHPEPQAFLEELARSGEEDLYLGALIQLKAAQRHIDAFVRVARAQKDPWFDLMAERELAAFEENQGQWWKAEERLQSALQSCREQRLLFRCASLEKRLADLYLSLHRPADAFEHAWSGWLMGKEMRDLDYEQQFLQELAQIALLRRSLPSASAYLRESLVRGSATCTQKTYVHRNLAQIAYLGFQPEEARRELDLATECGLPLGLSGAATLSELAHYGVSSGDAEHLVRALDELRRTEPSAGDRALMALIEGRFELAREKPSDGRRLLREAISLAESEPSDVNARRARAFAFSSLIIEAGSSGAYEEALALTGEELRVKVSPRCVLAVAVEQERTLLVARGGTGQLLGHYDASRTAPLGEDVSKLVPPAMREALGGCEHVDVLARPPVHGHTGLLPTGMAWSYRVGRTAPVVRADVGSKHLVVTNVEISRALHLPRLPPLEPSRIQDPARVLLTGAQATPSRVLAEMASASEIEIHSHGLISPEVSDASLVVLAPESDGRYALTASQIRQQSLVGAPLVLLATCSAAKTAPFPHEPFSLPVAFIEAGARAVLASTVDIPDTAGRFFDAVRERIRAGARPSVALRNERQRWLEANPEALWIRHVLLFE